MCEYPFVFACGVVYIRLTILFQYQPSIHIARFRWVCQVIRTGAVCSAERNLELDGNMTHQFDSIGQDRFYPVGGIRDQTSMKAQSLSHFLK